MKTLKAVMDSYVLIVLRRCNGNRTKAAKHLDISIRTLRNYINAMKKDIDKCSIIEDIDDIRKIYQNDGTVEPDLTYDGFPTNKERLHYQDTFPNGKVHKKNPYHR